MAVFTDRTGDFTKKKYLYKFYKNGYTSRRPKYITAGQYIGYTGELLEGSVGGNAYIDGSINENGMSITGNGDSNLGVSGTYRVSSDQRRKMDIENIVATFGHSGAANGNGSLYYYEIKLFDYQIRRTTSGNTIKAFYKDTELASATMGSGYDYIRMREAGGTFYIDRSSDGTTWTNWTSHAIDFDADIVRGVISLEAQGGAGGIGMFFANAWDMEITDRRNNLLAIETHVMSDLEFTETINTPASSTPLTLPYSPLDVPKHCDIGNFVEAYVNFYDDGAIRAEPILDENGDPIQDQNGDPIYGVVIHGNVPEQASILKFSGYISSIDYDYDNATITLHLVSHGETASNSVVRGDTVAVPVLSQAAQNTTVATSNSRQTITVSKMTKVDEVTLVLLASGGGSASVEIGRGNEVIGSSDIKAWSGPFSQQELTFFMLNSVYLEAGVTYWIRVNGLNTSWRYQNANVYPGGSRQSLGNNVWTNVAGDVYFVLSSTQPQLNLQLSGDSSEIASEIFSKSLALDYSPLYLEAVEHTDYDINVGLNIDSAKNAINALYRQLPSGWFYRVDIGTGAMTMKNRNANPDHLLVFGRDFTEMKVTKDIDGIINDVYYIGGELVEQGAKLTTRSFDVESMAEYRQGLAILSNDKVTRYDTAALLSQNAIGNNNEPRITTEITLSAARYNTETVRIGDVVKIVNGDRDVLRTTLVVADINYRPNSITISLDSAPRNLSRTIDAIQRDLQNQSTAAAAAVV